MSRRPAYSSAFEPGAIQYTAPLLPLESITREWAWGGATGKGVKVAVIDSGVDADHPSLPGGVDGYVSITRDGDQLVYDTEPHRDVYGHGTACAGIIRALAPECEIYSIRVLGAALSGNGHVFAAGVRWAIENGMQVCNLSLGTTKNEFAQALHELVDLAYFKRIALVTAANNMPKPSFPSVYASVIAVASHEVTDAFHYYFNPDPPVEFGALGIDVHVPWKDGSYITATGNSFAAPHIAGLVTLLLSKHPGLTMFQIKTILKALADNTQPVPA